MFAVIFEVEPRPERRDEYLALGKALGPQVEASEGFIDIDRFASRQAPGRLLSLSTWRDEDAIVRWRTHAGHHRVQQKGRGEIFLDYRLRVGEITSDTAAPAGVSPRRIQAAGVPSRRAVTVTDIIGDTGRIGADALAGELGLDLAMAGLLAQELFESVYTPGKLILLASWRDAEAAGAWTPAKPGAAETLRHRHVGILRDYGMFERREAPQFYPEVRRPEAPDGVGKRAASA